jgi:putative nucleotidyltransferase with HDIG domain
MSADKKKESIENVFSYDNKIPWGLLLVVTVLFTIILYPDLVIKKHLYRVGDIAKKDIKAPRDFFYEDIETTEKNRQKAIEAILTVYDYDTTLANDIARRLRLAFSELRAVVTTDQQPKDDQTTTTAKPITSDGKEAVHDRIQELKDVFEEKIGISVSNEAYKILEKEKFSVEVEDLIGGILKTILKNGVVANKEILLRESDKGINLSTLETKTENTVFNLKLYYGPDQAKTMIRVVAQPLIKDANYAVRSLIVDFAQRLLQPNITLNKSETEERKKKAAEAINPFRYQIKAGEMLLREGERVTEDKLKKIGILQDQSTKLQMLISSMGTVLILLCLFWVSYIIYIKEDRVFELDRNKNLLFLASVLIVFAIVAKVSAHFAISEPYLYFSIPFTASAMIVCLFMGLDIAIPFSIIMSVCIGIIFRNRFDIFIYCLLSCTMGAYWIQHCSERKVFIEAGLKLGLFNMILVLAVDVYMADYYWANLLRDFILVFLGGVAAGVITAGIAPLIEIAFGYATDITLLELANLDRPILRRLMLEAPGTYHHSVIVGTMVEAAASAIGANPLLARVCGYYHDIGKIKKPLYFIENQKNGKNRHDKLAPSMSSLILIAHVKGGVELAKENKLVPSIIDAIQQHHGTSFISFFYEKAKQQKGDDAVKMDDFRYPGPKPQTREVGLVMLADVLEAASRTLDNPTPARIQGLVQDLINKIFSDGQLNNCELTLKDLNNIAKSFNKILSGIYHHRIEYPENVAAAGGKGKNGSTDKQQTTQPKDTPEKNTADGAGRLKRLGLS